MKAIIQRFRLWQWVLGTLGFAGGPLYSFYEDGHLRPGTIAFSLAEGVIGTFIMAWGSPFATRMDAKIKRLFARR